MHYCDSFEEVQKYWGRNLRYFSRKIALDGLSIFQKIESNSYLLEPRIHFLYFHHIFKDEKKKFDVLVSKLAQAHTFISHSEAVERLVTNKVDRPYISWSSDDGFKNNLDAAEILDKYGASCCFFVNPYSIGLRKFDAIEAFCREKLNMPPIEFLDWNEIRQLLESNHEVGAHTVYHDAVNNMDINTFENDLLECKTILEGQTGSTVEHFAYPYGKFKYFNREAYERVFKMGYTSCSTAVRGCHKTFDTPIEPHSLLIRREQIIAAWDIKHIAYFMTKSVKGSTFKNNLLPTHSRQ